MPRYRERGIKSDNTNNHALITTLGINRQNISLAADKRQYHPHSTRLIMNRDDYQAHKSPQLQSRTCHMKEIIQWVVHVSTDATVHIVTHLSLRLTSQRRKVRHQPLTSSPPSRGRVFCTDQTKCDDSSLGPPHSPSRIQLPSTFHAALSVRQYHFRY